MVEAHHLDWLANVVHMQKKNRKWRIYINFTNLNQTCPKDPYPLPLIDLLVESIAGIELLSLINPYFGYKQIKIYKPYIEKTPFTNG